MPEVKKLVPRLRESRFLTPLAAGREFTQPRDHRFCPTGMYHGFVVHQAAARIEFALGVSMSVDVEEPGGGAVWPILSVHALLVASVCHHAWRAALVHFAL